MKTITSVTVYPHSMEPKVKLRLLTQSENQIFLSKLKLTRLGCQESFRYNQYIGQEMAYKLYFTSCIKKLGLHCITYYYMGMSQKDWKQTNSRIRSWPRFSFSHPDRYLNRSCCNSSPQKVTNKEYEKIVLFVQSLYKAGLEQLFLFRLDWRPVTEESQLNAWARAGKQIKLFMFLFVCFLVWPYNKHLLNELGRSVWENLDLGRWYRPHCVRSVLATLVKILP